MKNPLLKKLLPHILALVLFVVVSLLFCRPVLDGYVMNQHDNVGWKGMAQNAFEYKATHGHFPLWNTNLFSGMPNYQVAMEGKSVMPDMVKIMSLGLPKPINFFFLACVCFYILCLALRVRPLVAMLAGIAYAFSTYNPVIIAAGHDTQMLSTAFMPLVMAGLMFTYHKNYWLGLALTSFGAYMQVGVNHLQVTYYFFLIAALVTIFYVIKWIREKDFRHMAIAGAITVFSALLAVAGNWLALKTTSEYSKYTMRGGKDVEVVGDSVSVKKTEGLDTAYAFEYSLGKAETFTLLMPRAFGGGNYERFSEDSRIAKKLTSKGFSGDQLAPGLPKYWGKIFTAGPAYLGVLIFLFGLIGFVIIRGPLKWALLAATLLGIFMTWGKYFAGFNVFLFENLPLYNKFRAPSFAQVIPQFTLSIMAALTLQKILFDEKSREFLQKNIKPIGYTLGALFVVLLIVWFGMDYSNTNDTYLVEGIKSQGGSEEIARTIVSSLKSERKAMFFDQILRALGIAVVGMVILFSFLKRWIKPAIAAVCLLVVSTLDITLSSYKFFNNDNDQNTYRPDGSLKNEDEKLFVPKDLYTASNFNPSSIDQQILQDKTPHYRVLNLLGANSGGTFSESRTSYFHRSVGGYHPAKLRIYQDIIEKYFATSTNPVIMNMLNTKYLITQSPFTRNDTLLVRTEAYGPAWLVKNVRFTSNRAESLTEIGKTDLRETAIVENSLSKLVVQPQWDSTASIQLKSYDNDAIEYTVNGNGPQFAVFSEIYYPKGWNAYIDNKKVDYVNANYVLRGLSIPAGQHTVKFVFEPSSVKSGRSIGFIASILIAITLLGGLYMAWRESRKKTSS